MQQALNCAGKCDCCDKLQQQINAINSRLANIKAIDENTLKSSLKLSLAPDLNTIAAGAVAVLANRLEPQIKGLLDSVTNVNIKQGATEKAVNEAARLKEISDLEARQKYNNLSALEREVRDAQYAKNIAVQGYNKTQVDKLLTDAELSRQFAEAKAQRQFQAEIQAAIKRQAELDAIAIRNASTNAVDSVARSAATNAIETAANAAKQALNANNEVTGLKGLYDGLKGRVGALGEAIGRLESAVGGAVVSAAKAIGISEAALASTGRILGKIADIFNIIGTFAVLFEQLATLNVLGGRIDAVENEMQFLGNSISGILGKLLGLQNRIGRNEASVVDVKNIAIDAKGIGEAANLKAGAAQVTAARAEGFATTALGKANQAQLTADGAVQNAATANTNATTAYTKAAKAEGIGEQAKRIANDALGKAGTALTTALTAIALYQGLKALRGLQGIPGIPGRDGRNGIDGRQGVQGVPGVTTVVQIPGVPGRDGAPGRQGNPGIPGRNGRNGIDVNPADLAGLRALIIAQHATTRTNVNATTTGLVSGVKSFFTTQIAVVTALITAIAKNTYIEKALSVLTFAVTVHNGFMLSNNLAQTLGTIIDQVLGLILPKGLDGTPISIGNVLGKVAHEIIADSIGEKNYKTISEDWAKANRIYQAGINVFNQIGNAVGLVTAGMEVIGGNVAKIGNALKVWGVIGEKAYSWMNPQPNLKGKFFNFINTASEKANTIAMMVAIPIGMSIAAVEINGSIGAIKKELDQEDPKDDQGHPITDKLGNPLKWEPGVTVPDPTKTVLAQEQAKADSKNIITATLEDIFDGGD